jgi:hypothetical protein
LACSVFKCLSQFLLWFKITPSILPLIDEYLVVKKHENAVDIEVIGIKKIARGVGRNSRRNK